MDRRPRRFPERCVAGFYQWFHVDAV